METREIEDSRRRFVAGDAHRASAVRLFGRVARDTGGPGSDVEAMAGFRNILVGGDQIVDREIVRDVVEQRLDDLLAFVTAIRQR